MTAAPRRLRHPRSARLVRGADFQRVYRTGSRARGTWCTLALCANGLGHTRLGLSVGKVAWKLAVDRNRARRVFREAFRLSAARLPPGLDLVLIASPPARQPELHSLCAELEGLARKALRRLEEKRAREATQAP
jgi:ribonuclease P protein component